MKNKKMIALCMVASMSMLVACGSKVEESVQAGKATQITTETATQKKIESESQGAEETDVAVKWNHIFDALEQHTTSIQYAIADQVMELSDAEDLDDIFTYLSALEVEPCELIQNREGGSTITFITTGRKYSLTMYGHEFTYEGKSYVTLDKNIDITRDMQRRFGIVVD